ncbi:MAG: tRNA (adenosine(37)-N6)-dimethylallyltransferase MiaA [Rickettsiaceae bacterium]|nr:tRNA (adenosine(37)-N6)-dimethylallyltransferase MiaA [Rickettsiaceae bacterium]
MRKAVIICGPTGAGKSALGNILANKNSGAIINADSMQLYSALEKLTSSPNFDSKSQIPHYLYNYVNPTEKFNIATYLHDFDSVINNIEKQTIFIIGGTGLYINGIINGIPEIPNISSSVKEEVSRLKEEKGLLYLHKLLSDKDQLLGKKISHTDTQRLIRAAEVFLATGKSIFDYQDAPKKNHLSNFSLKIIYLKPKREFLHQICYKRFEGFFANESLEEIRDFVQRYHNLKTALDKTVGLNEMKAYLSDVMNKEEALLSGFIKTRQYAKRQYTWFNNKLPPYTRIVEYDSISEFDLLSRDLSEKNVSEI